MESPKTRSSSRQATAPLTYWTAPREVIEMTAEQVAAADRIAARRTAENLVYGRVHSAGTPAHFGDKEWAQNNVGGTRTEAAIAAYLGLPHCLTGRKERDLAGYYEVRGKVRNPYARHIVKVYDPDDAPVIHVACVNVRRYTSCGWIFAKDAKELFYPPSIRREFPQWFYVPFEGLHPLAELPSHPRLRCNTVLLPDISCPKCGFTFMSRVSCKRVDHAFDSACDYCASGVHANAPSVARVHGLWVVHWYCTKCEHFVSEEARHGKS